MSMIVELKYSNTNTYLVHGKKGGILFDTGWAGTFPMLCKTLGEKKLKLQDINYIFISHFHPDHMGIAQEIANFGVQIAIADVQKDFVHISDSIFEKEHNKYYIPINDEKLKIISFDESRALLKNIGISGELLYTPGHSDDSISLWLDKEKALIVGDLNPLYELEMHQGSQIADTWEKLLKLDPKIVYYGHAKPYVLTGKAVEKKQKAKENDIYMLVKRIMKYIDKGYSAEMIRDKTGADITFIQDTARMYLTHQNVSVQGILDRIEIKGK